MADQQTTTGGNVIDLRASQATGTTSTQTSGATTPQASSAAAGGATSGSLFSKFEIPETVQKKYPDLVPLILETESMTDEERQYWFQILPIMTEPQVQKLRDILANEKRQLEELDKKYNQKIEKLNEKHVAEWKEFETKQKREQRLAAEASAAAQDKATEEDLLKQLENN